MVARIMQDQADQIVHRLIIKPPPATACQTPKRDVRVGHPPLHVKMATTPTASTRTLVGRATGTVV
jgi:hypothetical protein